MGLLLAVACSAGQPVSFDEAAAPLGERPASAPSVAPSPSPSLREQGHCLFDAECPKGKRCEAPRRSSAPSFGTCIDAPHG